MVSSGLRPLIALLVPFVLWVPWIKLFLLALLCLDDCYCISAVVIVRFFDRLQTLTIVAVPVIFEDFLFVLRAAAGDFSLITVVPFIRELD